MVVSPASDVTPPRLTTISTFSCTPVGMQGLEPHLPAPKAGALTLTLHSEVKAELSLTVRPPWPRNTHLGLLSSPS